MTSTHEIEQEPLDPFSLEAVQDNATPRAQRMVFYGVHGCGKTTLGSRFPGALLQRTEDGLRNIRVRHFPAIATSYSDIAKGINAVLRNPSQVGTFVHDSLDWTEPLIWAETCQRANIPSIESPGYGKGYVEADKVWSELLSGFDAIRDAGVNVVLLAHADITKFEPPDADKYDRYDLALHKRARAMIHEWADLVGFINEKVITRQVVEGSGKNQQVTHKGMSTGQRVLYLERRATHEAKNGFGLPAEMELNPETAPLLMEWITASYAQE